MPNAARIAPLSLLLLAASAACGAPAETKGGAGAEPTGEASLAVTTVPSAVQCIQITATGSSTVVRQFAVTGGASSVGLSLGQLPLGGVAIAGQAFSAACASIGGTTPTWVADPQMVTLKTGLVSSLTLSFRQNNAVAATANFVGNVADLSLGSGGTFWTMTDGTVHAAGYTYGTYSPTVVPTALTNVAQVAGGGSFDCALSTTGNVSCWGSNNYGQLATPPATLGYSTTPVPIAGVANAIQITAGEYHACALLSTGQVQCWGYNADGEVGSGAAGAPVVTPVTVDYGAVKITAGGYHTCSIHNDGAVSCWGQNNWGQIGDNTTTNRPQPTLTGIIENVNVAAGGYHTCAQRADGTLRCWGMNIYGQVGDGTTTGRLTPTIVPLTGVSSIAIGFYASCARAAAGVYCWGHGGNAELGDGTGQNSASPLLVPGLATATAVRGAGSAQHFCATMPDMSTQCWGANWSGQLGNGTFTNGFLPAAVQVQ